MKSLIANAIFLFVLAFVIGTVHAQPAPSAQATPPVDPTADVQPSDLGFTPPVDPETRTFRLSIGPALSVMGAPYRHATFIGGGLSIGCWVQLMDQHIGMDFRGYLLPGATTDGSFAMPLDVSVALGWRAYEDRYRFTLGGAYVMVRNDSNQDDLIAGRVFLRAGFRPGDARSVPLISAEVGWWFGHDTDTGGTHNSPAFMVTGEWIFPM